MNKMVIINMLYKSFKRIICVDKMMHIFAFLTENISLSEFCVHIFLKINYENSDSLYFKLTCQFSSMSKNNVMFSKNITKI